MLRNLVRDSGLLFCGLCVNVFGQQQQQQEQIELFVIVAASLASKTEPEQSRAEREHGVAFEFNRRFF